MISDAEFSPSPHPSELFVQSELPLGMPMQPEADVPVKPFLRWAGGKSRLLGAILPFVPEKFKNYHEPFLGSGAMFFALRHRAQTSFLADLNSELVNLWRVVQREPEQLLAHMRPYMARTGEAEYYAVRSEVPEHHLDRAARFLYLNQTAWNGLWRENKWGVFNVPWGARDFRGIDPVTLKHVSRALEPVSIDESDFREAAKRTQKGDFIYFDPPYLPISDTSKFAGYNGKRFRRHDLEELADLCKHLTKKGVHWIVSNRDNEHIREIFGHATVVPFTTRRSVAAQNKRHVQPKDSPEVVVFGGPKR
ncbi:DNA adenine methylase [Burkholderia cepacia]|uniref:DNA adenine methylase n=1 Tax=Burkholderia cepacia TaxID=292 RepID=UPI001CF35198|nr:DNA adenine methylase [Burkholderia cepacia]MCA8135665.1 DNA adenine methylase [Burkholderia cepacia]